VREYVRENCDGRTAVCPRCGIDSVIGSAAGYPLTREFLSAMEQYWFGDA
jgi:acetone carboxylase gamma subunit